MAPRRRFRKKRPMGPLARLGQKKNFWGKVARVAKFAVESAGEIKRWLVAPGTITLAPNTIDDTTGPLYTINAWSIRPIQEGLVQGTDQNERLGNKIGLKGIYLKGTAKNNFAGVNYHRIMIIRTRKNFLLDTTPDSPLPDDFISFPRYRDVQVLWDSKRMLKPTGSADGDSYFYNKYIPLRGDTFYNDNTGDKPDKGTIYVCMVATNISLTANYKVELTYHDKA